MLEELVEAASDLFTQNISKSETMALLVRHGYSVELPSQVQARRCIDPAESEIGIRTPMLLS